jgi:hypothetical protein
VNAACAPLAELFMPIGNGSGKETYPVSTYELTEVCRGCEIRDWCAEDALADRSAVGFRAGMTSHQRAKIRKAR